MNSFKILGIIVILVLTGSFFYSMLTIRYTTIATIAKLRIEPMPIFMVNENIIEDVEWNVTLSAQLAKMPKQTLYRGYTLSNEENDLFQKFGTDIEYKVVLKVKNMNNIVLFDRIDVFYDGKPRTYSIYLNQSEVKANEQIEVVVTVRYVKLYIPDPIDETVTKEPEDITVTTTVEELRKFV